MKIVSKIAAFPPEKKITLIRFGSLLLFLTVVVALSWHADDAYHAYTMAKNLVEGNGFVYNIGERVNASTCPLFTLVVAAVYLITHNMFISGIAVCIIFSTLAFYILVFKICKSAVTIISSTVILIASSAFISYTTSGLENSLLFFLAAVFLYVFLQSKKYSKKQLFILSLMVGLIAATRMDAALLFAIPAIYAFIFCRGFTTKIEKNGNNIFTKYIVPVIQVMPIAIIGLLPFIIWEAFSLIYYGFLVPNTAFAKLNNGFPVTDYLIRGVSYIIASGIYDIICVAIPLIFIVICIIKRKISIDYKLISLGVLIYFLYIIYIGGDFMVGRFFTLPLFISVICLASLADRLKLPSSENISKRILKIMVGVVIILLLFNISIAPLATDNMLYGGKSSEHTSYLSDVIDTREHYWTLTSPWTTLYYSHLHPELDTTLFENQVSNYDPVINAINNGYKGIISPSADGIVVFTYGDKIQLQDKIGLGDAFLSKLPAHQDSSWSIGHMYRDIPDGYNETLKSGENMISDPLLHEFYDKLCIIIKDNDLLSPERLKTILNMNLGMYDYLIDNYTETLTTNYKG